MTGRRGWQIAGVAGLWLTYGFILRLPDIHNQIGDRIYTLPVAIGAGLAIWATVGFCRYVLQQDNSIPGARLGLGASFLLFCVADMLCINSFLLTLFQLPESNSLFSVLFTINISLLVIGGLTFLMVIFAAIRTSRYKYAIKVQQNTLGLVPKKPPQSSINWQSMTHQSALSKLIQLGCGFIAIFLGFIPTISLQTLLGAIVVATSVHIWLIVGAMPSPRTSREYFRVTGVLLFCEYFFFIIFLGLSTILVPANIMAFPLVPYVPLYYAIMLSFVALMLWWLPIIDFVRFVPELLIAPAKAVSAYSNIIASGFVALLFSSNSQSFSERATAWEAVFWWTSMAVFLALPIAHFVIAIRALRPRNLLSQEAQA